MKLKLIKSLRNGILTKSIEEFMEYMGNSICFFKQTRFHYESAWLKIEINRQFISSIQKCNKICEWVTRYIELPIHVLM